MAFAYLVTVLRVDGRAAVDIKNQVETNTVVPTSEYSRRVVKMIKGEMRACDGGVRQGNLWAAILDSTAALPTGNIACTRANAAGKTITFTYGGVAIVLTEGVDFLRGASDTTCAANLATAINNIAPLSGLYTAAGSVGNCGLTGKIPTPLMQKIVMSTNDGTAFAFTQLTGGDDGAAQFFLRHFAMNRTP